MKKKNPICFLRQQMATLNSSRCRECQRDVEVLSASVSVTLLAQSEQSTELSHHPTLLAWLRCVALCRVLSWCVTFGHGQFDALLPESRHSTSTSTSFLSASTSSSIIVHHLSPRHRRLIHRSTLALTSSDRKLSSLTLQSLARPPSNPSNRSRPTSCRRIARRRTISHSYYLASALRATFSHHIRHHILPAFVPVARCSSFSSRLERLRPQLESQEAAIPSWPREPLPHPAPQVQRSHRLGSWSVRVRRQLIRSITPHIPTPTLTMPPALLL